MTKVYLLYKKSCSENFCNKYRKTSMLESLFNRAANFHACRFMKKTLQCRCFPVNIAKVLRTPILKNVGERPLLEVVPYKYHISDQVVRRIAAKFNFCYKVNTSRSINFCFP